MFRQATTIIVGAGASCEINLPSGHALKGLILSLLRPSRDNAYGFVDEVMLNLVKSRAGPDYYSFQQKIAPVREAAERIRKGLPLAPSIDNFLHSHYDDDEVVNLGKFAIATTILRAEAECFLFDQRHYLDVMSSHNPIRTTSASNERLENSWYPAFAQLLMSGIQKDDIERAFNGLRFIVFNYDRCLEQFIWLALQAYFDIDGHHAAAILSDVDFIHPYGSLGPLPWQSDDQPVALGDTSSTALGAMASRIKTFTESVAGETSAQISEAMNQAETLLILGFGYLDQNIQLLSETQRNVGGRVFSTAHGVSLPDQAVMRDAMATLGNVDPMEAMIEQGKCADLFANYRLHLSLR